MSGENPRFGVWFGVLEAEAWTLTGGVTEFSSSDCGSLAKKCVRFLTGEMLTLCLQ